MKILVTSVGSNTAISLIKGLKLILTDEIIIYGSDINDKIYCAGAKWVDFFLKSPYATLDIYEKWIIETVINNEIDCVIPIHDIEIEEIAKIAYKKSEITFWAVNKPEIIDLCNDKLKANDFVTDLNILVPKWGIEYKNLNLPVLQKPIRGVSSKDITMFYKKSEIENTKQSEQFFYQEFIQGGEEYTVDCYSSYDGIFYGGMARKRIETKGGISTKGITIFDEIIINQCEKILNAMNYKGASNIQFIKKNNKYYFIEINPRFSGAGILSYKANFNSPYFTYLSAKKISVAPLNSLKLNYGLVMTRYWEEVFNNE